MELRKFTDKGLEQFRAYLHEMGEGLTANPSLHLLTGSEFSKPMRGSVQLENTQFVSRLDLARYLDQTFEELPERPNKLMNDVHLENKPKRGPIMNKNAPGSLYRFVNVIQQLDVTYDLYSMSGPEIVSLLPGEFNHWKAS